MKLTQEIIDQIQEAMLHTKKNGDIHNRTKSSTSKHNFIK